MLLALSPDSLYDKAQVAHFKKRCRLEE